MSPFDQTNLTDEQLFERWVEAGDRVAGDRLVRRHYASIQAFFRLKVGDAHALDLAQETFTRLSQSARNFQRRSCFRSFLFGIARNILNSFLRKRYRRGEFDPASQSIADMDGVTPSRVISKVMKIGALARHIQTIPVDDLVLLELYIWQDLTAGELSKMFDMPENTVRKRVYNIKLALKKKIETELGALDDTDIEEDISELLRLLCRGPASKDEA